MSSMYKQRKKREIDPNAPPRPNLFSHEKSLKETKASVEEMQATIRRLEQTVHTQHSQIVNINMQLDQIRSYLASRRGDNK